MSAPTAPYATSGPEVLGPISGTSPNWSANFVDRGRTHLANPVQQELAGAGFSGWYSGNNIPPERRLFKRGECRPAPNCIAEPHVQGGNYEYFARRGLNGQDNPELYRRTLRFIPEPLQLDRPVGKKFIPEPQGAPPRAQGVLPMPADLRNRQPGSAPEPSMPRLSRPYGATILRQCDQELSYERAMGRKIRVGQNTYAGAGRAGDLSLSYAPPKRPEDTDPAFFKHLQDSPTFIRFVQSLPAKPAVSPHERRAAWERHRAAASKEADKSLVATLELPGVNDD